MKIIKKDYTETWYSPRRYMKDSKDINYKLWVARVSIGNGDHAVINHRKNGPAIINDNTESWIFDDNGYRKDGPASIICKKKIFIIRDFTRAEELYWND